MAAEDAKKIRQALKKAGYGTREVGVVNSSYSMGSSVTVTIKDPTANGQKIREIAEGFQRVRRCESSGEILSGVNFFVSVRYSREAEQAMTEEFEPAVRAAYEELAGKPQGFHTRIPGTAVALSLGSNFDVFLHDTQGTRRCWADPKTLGSLAFQVALIVRAGS